jgi:hypothetical protein
LTSQAGRRRFTASSLVGIVGPKDMEPNVVKTLHDAFSKDAGFDMPEVAGGHRP